MADGDQITPEEYARWTPASEALKRVTAAMQGDWGIAAATIVRRLNAGLIRAHMRTGTLEQAGKVRKLKDYVAVPATVVRVWDNSDHPADFPFWVSGDADVSFQAPGAYGYQSTQTWQLFGIRFDPAGVADVIAGTGAAELARIEQEPAPTQGAVPEAPQQAEPETKGPPVSKAALEAWFKAYQAAFIGAEDTEARALESARGCFPGKSVSRDVVRGLRGAQKRGRKEKSAK